MINTKEMTDSVSTIKSNEDMNGVEEEEEEIHANNLSIAVLGDPKVGKTSLISSLLSNRFSERVPPVLHTVEIPAENTSENVVTWIIDTSSNQEDLHYVKRKIVIADVILCVYDVTRVETIRRLTYWMKLIHKTKDVHVILVGNKIDLINETPDGLKLEEIESQIRMIMETFKFIEASTMCSARNMLHVPLAFSLAQKSVLYPIAPLYDVEKTVSQPLFKKALKRIFRLLDLDRDNALNKKEMKDYQYSCFDLPIQDEELEGILHVLYTQYPDSLNPERGVLFSGFVYLNELFIKHNRAESCWQTLKCFGYDDELRIRPLETKLLPPPKDYDQTYELTGQSAKFLTELFKQFAKDERLTKEQMDEIFSICNEPIAPWCKETTPSDIEGFTLSLWISMWRTLAVTETEKFLAYFAYLGFIGSPPTALQTTKRRRNLHSALYIPRNIIQCFVFGSKKCGKSALLEDFVGRQFQPTYTVTKEPRYVSNNVHSNQSNIDRTLMLYEFPEQGWSDYKAEQLKNSCDIVCFLFDPTDRNSFEYVKETQHRIPDSIPRLLVATKCDLLESPFTTLWADALAFCASLEVPEPVLISSKTRQKLQGDASLYNMLVHHARSPKEARPINPERRRRQQLQRRKYQFTVAAIGIVTVATIAIFFRKRLTTLFHRNEQLKK